jgi:hypothetical protein
MWGEDTKQRVLLSILIGFSTNIKYNLTPSELFYGGRDVAIS